MITREVALSVMPKWMPKPIEARAIRALSWCWPLKMTGAPLMVAVFMNNVSRDQLRNTLFVLWFTLVTIKMSAFAVLGVELHLFTALMLLPVAAIGHIAGLKAHEAILKNDRAFKRWTGLGLMIISLLGLWNLFQ